MTSRSDGSSEPWIADGVWSVVNMISSGRDLTSPRGGGAMTSCESHEEGKG